MFFSANSIRPLNPIFSKLAGMSAQDLPIDKINLINWITRLQDASIIARLKKIQLEEDNAETTVPEWQKEIVRERISNTSKKDYLSLDQLDVLMN